MRWMIANVLLALAALPAASDPLDDLGSDFAEARRRAHVRLVRAGPEIEPLLIQAYAREGYVTRVGILAVLGERGCVAALSVVLDDLGTAARSVREAQARYLVAIGNPGRDALDAVIAGEDPDRATRAREVLALTVRVVVERKVLAETLGPELHYEGQFASLLRNRELSADVLMDMVANDHGGYRFVIPVEHVVDIQEIRAKAADALSDVGRKRDLPRLRALLGQVRGELAETEDYIHALWLENLVEVLCYVLHGLGDVEPAEALARDLWDRTRDHGYMWGREENLDRFGMALVLARMGRLRQSKRVYEEILADPHPEAQRHHGGAAYNLACILGLLGRVEDAYGMLLDAVMLDPMAIRAALEDGDLKSIRAAYPDLERRLMAAAPPMPGDSVDEGENAEDGD